MEEEQADSEWYEDTDYEEWGKEAMDLLEEDDSWMNFGDDSFAIKTGVVMSAAVFASLF
jgi:hypothetical protein